MTQNLTYAQKKKVLLAQARALQDSSVPVALNKATTNLFRDRKQGKVARLNVRGFNGVIRVNADEKWAEVEGMATYETIVRETLRYGFMPAVVPQLKTITIGGAITGVGIESSSWRYGFSHETMLELEILLPNGKIIVAAPRGEHKDLFYGFPNSYGTLGYILKAKIRLVPVKQFVELHHIKFHSAKDFFATIQKVCDEGKYQSERIDFVDGVVFKPGEMYLTVGRMTDNPKQLASDYTYKQIYYHSIQTRQSDVLTIHDYLWRWDTDWFWCSKNLGAQNKFLRRLYGRKRLRSDFYMKLMQFEMKYRVMGRLDKLRNAPQRETVIQDVEIPISKCAEFLDFYRKNIDIRPLWICPARQHDPKVEWSLFKTKPGQLYCNFGFWDSVVAKPDQPEYTNRLLEIMVTKLGGKKSLYSSVHYSEKEFWQLYNKPVYDLLKSKYDPSRKTKDLYQKTVKRG